MLHHLQALVEPIADPDVEYCECCEYQGEDEFEGIKRHVPELHEEMFDAVLANDPNEIENHGDEQDGKDEHRHICPDERTLTEEHATQYEDTGRPEG